MDQYGCKPFILVPLIGYLLDGICMFFNYAFLDDFPIEFFYADNISYVFGGITLFYLGSHGYGSLNTKESERSSTLGRYDGFEISGVLGGKPNHLVFIIDN